MLRRRPRLSYANVVATMALFVALGGSSYAAVQLSKGQVKKKHLAKNAVVSKKVKDGSLLAQDFMAGQLPAGPKGDTGPQGPKGDHGPKGDTGTNGSPAASAFTGSFSPEYGGGYGPASGIGSGTSTEYLVQQVSPAVPIIARDLFARHIYDAGAAGSIRGFTLRVNGVDTALTCTLTRPEQSCQNTSAAVTIPAGSLLSIRTSQSGSSITGTGRVLVSFRATTP
jgi:hypothetical protein